MVWLKIRKDDINYYGEKERGAVVVWLKIRKDDILLLFYMICLPVVVWLKIRKDDIKAFLNITKELLWFD